MGVEGGLVMANMVALAIESARCGFYCGIFGELSVCMRNKIKTHGESDR